jgi:TRAP transporter TAXI family solute receptor
MRVSASWGKCLSLSVLAYIGCVAFLAGTATAQSIPRSLEQGGTDTTLRDRRNAWTVGIAGGQLSGTYMTFANELAEVLDDGDNLRVIPIVTYGAASNLDDLLYLRQVDVAVTQADVFDYFRNQRKTPNLESRVHYIVRLPVSEVHILASTDVKTIEDLRGKKVSFGPAGSASSLTGTIVFQRLGVHVEQVLVDNASALQKLKSGEIAALVRVIGKPIDFFAKIPASAGLHFVPIPFTKTFADYYTLGELTSKEYPGLVPEGQTTDTIAVPAVLAVFNWSRGTDRYRRVERFVDAFFSKWDKFREPPRHPKWRDVNLAATVPGWTRWSVAEDMLRRLRAKEPADPQVASADFYLTQQQRDAIFLEFLQWQKQRNGGR